MVTRLVRTSCKQTNERRNERAYAAHGQSEHKMPSPTLSGSEDIKTDRLNTYKMIHVRAIIKYRIPPEHIGPKMTSTSWI